MKYILVILIAFLTSVTFAQSKVPGQIQVYADSLFCTSTLSHSEHGTVITFEGINYKTSSIFIDTIHYSVTYPIIDTTFKGEYKTVHISHKSDGNLHATKTLFEIKTGKQFSQTIKLDIIQLKIIPS